MRNLITTSICIAGLALGSSAFAQDSDKSKNRLVEKLGLDEAQAAAVQEILSTKRAETLAALESILTPEQLEMFQERNRDRNRGDRKGRRSRDEDSEA